MSVTRHHAEWLALVDVFPSVGIDMVPVGYVAILAFSIVSATAIWRFQLLTARHYLPAINTAA